MLPGNLKQIMFPLCLSVALPWVLHKRGCLETETKKHSCHSFTRFFLGYDERETFEPVPIDMMTKMFESFLQIHIST